MVRRTNVQAVGVLVGVFLLGALAGGTAVYAHVRREQADLIGPHHQMRQLRGFERTLNLEPEQSRQIEAIFAKHHEEMERLKREMFEGCGRPMREKIDAIDAEIRAVLTPDQQRAFDQIRAERQRRGLEGPPGGPHHRRRGRGQDEIP